MKTKAVWIFGIINALSGLVICLDINYFSELGTALLFISFVSLYLYIDYFSDNFFYQLRIIFLSSIGYYAGVVKFIDPNLLFTGFGYGIHTFSVGVQMYGMTSIAILGSAIGMSQSEKTFCSNNNTVLKKPLPWLEIFWLSGIFSLITGYLSSKSYGPPVWEVAYASGEGEGQLLGNLQSIGVILITLNVLATIALKKKKFYTISFFICIYFLFFGILIRGGRLEFLAGLLALFIGISVAAGKRRNVSFIFYLFLIVFAILMEFLGYLRAVWTSNDTETMLEGYVRMFDSGTLFVGTISGIASSFANVVHMIDARVINFKFGIPYIEYILRTPPEFLYPDRPKDLSAIFDDFGYISIGGFFELAEAYLSFGLLGVFFIPMLISYSFAFIYKKALSGNLFFYIQLIAILSVFIRGAWYQTFAYYKSFYTGLIIYIGLVILCKITKYIRISI